MAGGNDANAKLLLHCDGADASTVVSDSSIGGNHGIAGTFGTAQLDSAYLAEIVSHWKCNDNAANTTVVDSAGSNAGTADANTDTLTASGKINTALQFTRSSSQDVNCGTATDCDFTSEDFSIAFWVWLDSTNNSMGLVGRGTWGSNGWAILRWADACNDGKTAFIFQRTGTQQNFLADTPLVVDTWQHVCVTRSSSTVTMYLNNVADGGGVMGGDIIGDAEELLALGNFHADHTDYLDGRLDDVRIYSKALSQAEIDLLYNGGAGTENGIGAGKFGISSLLLDGNSDYITFPDDADWNFGSGNFTIDFQVRFNGDPGAGDRGLITQVEDANNMWRVFLLDNNLYFQQRDGGSTDISIVRAWNPADATWYHIAIVRNGSDWHLFADGTQLGATGSDATAVADHAGLLYIGRRMNDAGTWQAYMDGWLDEIRISNTARWTSNFTAPTAAYSVDAPPGVTRRVMMIT